jgi:hypothetical protein
MLRGVRCFLGSLSVILLSMSAAVAAEPPASAEGGAWKAVNPPAPVLTALEPAAPAAASTPTLELRPVRMASAPLYTLSGASLLPAESQAVGFRTSNRAGGGMSRHVQWMIGGAVIGLIVGAVDGDPLGKAVIGGAIGFGLSYVVPL